MGTQLSKFTDEELQLEIESRKTARLADAIRRAQVFSLHLQDVPELVDILAPRHGRTSCSDENISNGLCSNGSDSPPRCYRCALLEVARGPYVWPPELRIELTITWSPVE